MPPADSDSLVDRRRLKRRLSLWRTLAVVAAMAAAALAIDAEGDIFGRPYVARLWVTGFISDDSQRDETLARLAKDDDVKAVVVRIDSPGGSVGGGEALYRTLADLAAKKPTVAVIGSLGTSAAYMAALGTERIFVRDSSVTGSIGVIMQTADVTSLLDRLGIKPETIKSAPLKAVPNPVETLTPEGREAAQAIVRDLFEQFVDMVALRRRMERADALRYADGRVFTGRQAKAMGLVDDTGGETAARAWLAETKAVPTTVRAVDVRPDDAGGWLGATLHAIGKSLFSERLSIDGPIAVWHPGLRVGE
ncbi:MAG: signal peptide peptidase SppA [Alphaproteobacteria bacterium]|nr:signal peptide peptidase SppA [Alphaproteobacteria bacterium]